MSKVSVTRMELLARKAQIALASQGRDLLEQKRTALLKEFLRMADTALERSDKLQLMATNASHALARTEAIAGTEAVRSAALASRAELPLQVTTTSVMGVKFPHIEQKRVSRPILGRGYSITGTSITIDEAASAFESEVEAIIELAEMELSLTRLAAEIQRTSRRLNALEHFLIPRLKAECDFIQKGYTKESLKTMPEEEAQQLLKEASTYASGKLSEIEIRARFTKDLQDTGHSLET